MAVTNQERVGKAMDLLRQGLAPFVEREVQEKVRVGAVNMDTVRRFSEDPTLAKKPIAQWDVAGLLKLMWETWNDVFRSTLGVSERNLVSELRGWRNKWAHQERYSSRDAERALDSAVRLLTAISAPEAEEIDKIMLELRRLTFEEQVRNEKKKVGGSLIESAAAGSLKPWREVVDAARRRREWTISAGGVRGGPLAGPHRPGRRRVQEPEGVLPADLPHRKPEAPARRRRSARQRRRRRSGRPAADELRRRQDALDARPLSPVFRDADR